MNDTVFDILRGGEPSAPAIAAAGRPALDCQGLLAQIDATAGYLRSRGIGRGDRVAIILPNGPELATAFLSVACCATAAPLNPALTEQEIEFCLRDFGARALVVAEGASATARRIAASLGLAVFDLRTAAGGPAGCIDLTGQPSSADAAPGRGWEPAGPDAVGLVLHTSGTTARPKIVPLTQRNLAASAGHIRETLRLDTADRCLNVMPLFHIHGLVACLLAPLSAGGSVYCSAGFNALRFMADLEASGATWYSAVPTMHQAILARAARNLERGRTSRLRFVRSSSAALPPRVLGELESVFGVPVIEAYGMTEAAHQMASNPLPPGMRRPGTVGLAAGPAVAIMDEHGELLPPGQGGEIVVRGPNIFGGYEHRPEANAAGFSDGWFRTGDAGVIDREGYVTITSRIKEIINRGGEKISPREIDEILLEHEAVREAVAFPIPHPTLGEAVGAAVVLRDGVAATERDILAFVAGRLTPYKIPSMLRILDELPRGATGKVRRLDMARQLGLV
ncbi:MAG: acyl--CoA ligase [Vicinamibacterales bacterium]